jgi:hypothetical protein
MKFWNPNTQFQSMGEDCYLEKHDIFLFVIIIFQISKNKAGLIW